MRTAFTTAEKNLFRSRPHRAKWRMAIHKPASLVSFIKTEEIETHPPSAIPWHPPDSGSSGDIKAGMTAWVGTTAGASDLGKIRIRKNYNGAYLQVAEAGSGLINWKAANYVTVMDEFRPWVKHIRYNTTTSQWVMDYDETYGGELETYKPYVNMGAPTVGVLQGGTFTGSFVGERAFSWDSDVSAHAWYFPDSDVSIAMGAASAPLHKTFSAASPHGRYVQLDVANAAGKSSTGRRLIFVFTNREQAPRVTFGAIEGGIEGGYRATFTAYDVGPDSIQDGAEIVIWEDASYNNVASTIGGNSDFRNNVVFRGWVVNESVQINPFTGAATFEAQTIDGYMDKSISYDLFLAQSDPVHSGSHWIDSKRLALDRVAANLLQQRSTVGGLVDFEPASGLAITEQIKFQSIPKGSWWSQMKTNYHEKGWLGYVAADLQSNIYAFPDNQITGGSAAIPFAMHIEKRDKRDTVELDHPHIDTNAQAQLYAVTDDVPLGAESPGTVMGYFGGQVEHQRGLLVDSQDTLITWTGNQRAKLNSKYPRVTVPLAGNYRIDPVPQCRVTMSLSANQNPRKISWNDKGFFPKNLSLEYDSTLGIVKSTVELEEIVNGIGGSAITFPRPDDIVPYPIEPPGDEPPPPGDDQGGGFGTVYVAVRDTLGRTRDFGATSPAWTDITPSSAGITYDFILDPWTPETTGYLSTDLGLYKSTDLDQSSPTWTLVLSITQMRTLSGQSTIARPYKVIASINVQNYVTLFFQSLTPNNLYCAFSSNGGDSWSVSTVTTSVNWMGGVDYVPHLVNNGIMLYAVTWNGSNVNLHKSSNGGASWSVAGSIPNATTGFSGFGQAAGIAVHCPYNDNDAGNVVYFILADVFGSQRDNATVARTLDGGSTFTILDSSGAGNEGYQVRRTGIETFTQDRLQVYYWDLDDTIQLSTDGGDSFSSGATASARPKASGGFPFNGDQYYLLTADGIYVSTDGAQTFTSKTGDWAFGFIGPATAEENMHGVIVPLWTE